MAGLNDDVLSESSKLDGTNYNIFKMQNTLQDREYWEIIIGVEIPPTTDKELQEYQRQRRKAHHIINISIRDMIIPHIRAAIGPKKAWDILKNLYEIVNQSLILFLTNKLHTLKMGTGGNEKTKYCQHERFQGACIPLAKKQEQSSKKGGKGKKKKKQQDLEENQSNRLEDGKKVVRKGKCFVC